jgi:hypothetical protein
VDARLPSTQYLVSGHGNTKLRLEQYPRHKAIRSLESAVRWIPPARPHRPPRLPQNPLLFRLLAEHRGQYSIRMRRGTWNVSKQSFIEPLNLAICQHAPSPWDNEGPRGAAKMPAVRIRAQKRPNAGHDAADACSDTGARCVPRAVGAPSPQQSA